MQRYKIASVAAVAGGALVCIFSTALQAAPITPNVSKVYNGAALGVSAERLSAAEPLACLVFEAGMPKQLALHGEQLVAWQHLERQHALLWGNRCSDTLTQNAVLSTQAAEDAMTLQTYEKNVYDFVSGLS